MLVSPGNSGDRLCESSPSGTRRVDIRVYSSPAGGGRGGKSRTKVQNLLEKPQLRTGGRNSPALIFLLTTRK